MSPNRPSYARTVLAAVVAVVLFIAALRNDVYLATSPPNLSWHIVLRKSYSIVAFAIVGYAFERAAVERARPLSPLGTALAVAAYSGAIELGQVLGGSTEGPIWNAVDVVCGALGGALATAVAGRLRARRA